MARMCLGSARDSAPICYVSFQRGCLLRIAEAALKRRAGREDGHDLRSRTGLEREAEGFLKQAQRRGIVCLEHRETAEIDQCRGDALRIRDLPRKG